MSNNFVTFDPPLANADNDATYAAKTAVTSGLSTGIADTTMHNKLFHQVSVMASAIGLFISGQGGAASDVDVNTLVTVFADAIKNFIAGVTAPSLWQTGDLKVTAVPNAPSGWLMCDGAAKSRSTYASLFGVIGGTWGAGDGSTTFNVPDFRGRAPVGAGAGVGLTARALAAKIGEENHQLSTAELAAHTHGINYAAHGHGFSDPGHGHGTNDPGHVHGVNDPTHKHYMYAATTPPGGNESIVQGSAATNGAHTGDTGGVTTGVSIQAAGVGTSVAAAATGASVQNGTAAVSANAAGSGTQHNTMQPSMVANFMIKT